MTPAEAILNNPTVKTIKQIAEVAGMFISVGTAAVSVASFLSSFLNLTPATTDPVLENINRIHAELKRVGQAIFSSWAIERQARLAFLQAHSSTALRTAEAFLRSGADRNDPDWRGRLNDALNNSALALTAVISNLEEGDWLRPDDLAAISQDADPAAWVNIIADRAEPMGNGAAWDYRWGLPVFLHALLARMVVMHACRVDESEVRSEYRRMKSAIDFITLKMSSGLRSHTLTPDEIRRIPTHGVPAAVVDIYGGRSVAGILNPIIMTGFFPPEAPFPRELLTIPTRTTEHIVQNARTLTHTWESFVARWMGLPELLLLAGHFEKLVAMPPLSATPVHSRLVYSGFRSPDDALRKRGTILGIDRESFLRWYRYDGNGDNDASGATGWHPNSGNRVGNGWSSLKHLASGDNGIVVGVGPAKFLKWWQYEGAGEANAEATEGWGPNSGNIIGRGWGGLELLTATPGDEIGQTTIYAVDERGDLRWFQYAGIGQHDPSGSAGWHPNSGNPIGNGWHGLLYLVAAGRTLFGVEKDGTLRWFRYLGNGEADASGATGWHSHSGNPIGRGWQTLRHLFGGLDENSVPVLFGVMPDGHLRYFSYVGEGEADPTGGTGWARNSGNVIGNRW